MFWQIHQKLMLSGFLSSGHLCLIHHLKFFDLMWPQQPPTEKVLKFNMIFHDSTKKYFCSKHQNKAILVFKLMNSRTWTTLKSLVVIFQALKPLQPQLPQWPQQPQWPQWPRQPHFIKKFTDSDDLIILSTQKNNTSPFL